ncbi:MAG: lipase maturation factor family protein [Opitutaceae bacterium]
MDLPADSPPRTPPPAYWLTRFFILRLLGIVYAVAFLAAALQLPALVGAHGLLPVGSFLDQVRAYYGSAAASIWHLPTLFWLGHSNAALLTASWIGFALAAALALGFANGITMAALWALYLSIVQVGQTWYGYGWESQLLETGFLAIFLCHPWDPRPFPRSAAPRPVIWLMVWLIFRIMLGAGLIKLRGDVVWRNLTALYYQFETQPIPGPFSRWFNFLPRGVLRGGVIFNFAAELGAPCLLFWPGAPRRIGGGIIILFQCVLILSGNLSFLNYLTIVPALACFDDRAWLKLCPFLAGRRDAALGRARRHRYLDGAAWALAALVAVLSVQPVLNLISPRQIMNTSFDPFDLVNTYGAFGSVGRERYDVVFEGTDSLDADPEGVWKPYVYRDLPVALNRRPPQVAPYQPRLDWQMWFASMSDWQHYPWTLHLVWKLLHNDPGALSLFAGNPFPGRPPKYIRATLYRYSFVPPNPQGLWWKRTAIGEWLPPLSADNPDLHGLLKSAGWLDAGGNSRSHPASSSNTARTSAPASAASVRAAAP